MIVYTPIDFPIELPDREILTDFVIKNSLTNLRETTQYTSMICPVASINNVTDWKDARQIFKEDQDLNNELVYAPNVLEKFPIFKTIMDSLPFTKKIAAVLNLHTTVLNDHRDEIIDPSDPMSPERYNVLLTPHYEEKSFFLSATENGPRAYPRYPKGYPVYAFNNKDVFHGADPVLNQRIILICGGLLDHERHEEIINRSVKKFKDYVLRYEDLNVI